MNVLFVNVHEENNSRPLAKHHPSLLLPVINRTVIDLNLELIACSNLKSVALRIGNTREIVQPFVKHGEAWGVKLEYLFQPEPWGSFGALLWSISRVNETTLVFPSDTLVDLDITEALAVHLQRNADITLVVKKQTTESAIQSSIMLDENEKVTSYNAIESQERYFYTGVCIVEPQRLRNLNMERNLDVYKLAFPCFIDECLSVYGYKTQGYSNTLQTHTLYQEAQEYLLQNAYDKEIGSKNVRVHKYSPLLAARYKHVRPGVYIGRSTYIHPSVSLIPPLCIGEYCSIGRDVIIGPNVIIGDNVVIDRGSVIKKSTVLERTYVGMLLVIVGQIVKGSEVVSVSTDQSHHVQETLLVAPI